MGKNPAFSFYVDDFVGGTDYMTDQEVGAYLRLLIDQFNRGHLTLDQIRRRLGASFESVWPSILEKFCTDTDGKFFNRRMDEVKAQREAYSQSRSNNRKKTSKTYDKDVIDISDSYEDHMGIRNKDKEIGDRIKGKEAREEGVTGEEGIDRSSNLPATVPADITPLSPAIIAGFVQNRVETIDGTLIAPNPRSCPMPDSWGENPAPEMWADELHRIWKECRVEESGVIGRFTYIQIASIGLPTRDIWDNALWYLAGKVVTKSKIFAFKTYWDGKHYLEDWMAKYEQLPEVKKIIEKATKADRDNDAAWEAVLRRQQQNAI